MISVPANKGFWRPQIWIHCMFWFLSMLTWSWTWTNEDLWGLWSSSTHTWIFSLRHQQMLVVVSKYHDLEQAKHRALFWAVPTQRAELLGGATMEPINQVALQQDHYFLVMSAGLLASAERSYITQNFWRIEVRSGTNKTNEEQRGGKQAHKHLCFKPILVAARVPFVRRVYNPAGVMIEFIPFSAFWLRSSVVSVLISLISDTRLIEPHDINLIFLGGGAVW